MVKDRRFRGCNPCVLTQSKQAEIIAQRSRYFTLTLPNYIAWGFHIHK